MKDKFIVVTNNPLVLNELGAGHNTVYREISYEEILKEIRDLIHKGHKLLSHPLSGSVKPKETPYKSVLISSECSKLDVYSLKLIEQAIEACDKFEDKSSKFSKQVWEDFQLVDFELIKGAIASTAYI